jgi:N-acetylneuraminate synthase
MIQNLEKAIVGNYTYVVAEIGINHNGSLEIAKQLMDLAKNSGCDAVKFQKRTLDIVYSQSVLDTPRESPWGQTTRDQKQGLEFSLDQYMEIDQYSKNIGLPWFASAWDIPSQEFLKAFDLPFNKVASAMITHSDFLKVVANERKMTFLSTGMATEQDIDRAVKIFQDNNCPIILMHTVSVYPCSEELLNLRAIQTLKEKYKVPVGYSGHESTVAPSLVATVLGAVAIERHITLDRAMYGTDQAASLAPRGIIELVSEIRRFPKMLGSGVKEYAPGEDEVAKKLRYWTS